MNEHLRQFGTVEIPREEYMRRLKIALATPATFRGSLAPGSDL